MKRFVLSLLVAGAMLLPAISATAGDLRGTVSITAHIGGVPQIYVPPPATVVVKEHHYYQPRHDHRHKKHWKHKARHSHDCCETVRFVEKTYYDDGRYYRREKVIVRGDDRVVVIRDGREHRHHDHWDD